MKNLVPACAAAAILSCSCAFSVAEVRLANVFSDNMVLQEGARAPVWGWADDGEEVTVEYDGASAKTTAKNGKWMVRVRVPKGAQPGVLRVRGKNLIELTNVVAGEVWLCSGQSNMEFPMTRATNAQAEIAASSNPEIRVFHVTRARTNAAAADVIGNWEPASPAAISNFSAVGYYFGRALQRDLHTPIGLIESSWGGTPIEAWTREGALREDKQDWDKIEQRYSDAMKPKQPAPGAKRSKRAKRARQPWAPGELYNGMIAPLVPFGIRGAIWYQGEANSGRAAEYRRLLPNMVRNWRRDWREGDFPFLIVQLAPFDKRKNRNIEEITNAPVESDWAELREAQLLAARTLPNAAVAVITDIGEKDNIHPTQKEPVGARLAAAAEAIAYHEKNEYSGPIYKGMRVKGNEVILSFDHARSGLESRGGALTGFAICGPDHKFVWASAVISGDKVIVSSPKVAKPVAVRYGWADFPIVNLWNKAGFPASPFRTDHFPGITGS
ncbi:MAG TPA: sialate O-acetylesterase [Verrucomicrobiae bacterium]|nr:sialate O-acetylesterase [Verrucomicrobiae bacterium]